MPGSMQPRTFNTNPMLKQRLNKAPPTLQIQNMPLGAKSLFLKGYHYDLSKEPD